MSWFSDLFGRDNADQVEHGLLVAEQTNPYAHLTGAEFRQALHDREEVRDRRHWPCPLCATTHEVPCEDCDGTGLTGCGTCPGNGVVECPYCKDEYGVWADCPTCGGHYLMECEECAGEGDSPCPTCAGTQKVDCPNECWARHPDTGEFFT